MSRVIEGVYGMHYDRAKEMALSARNQCIGKEISTNTWLRIIGDEVHCVYHYTSVIVFHPDGTLTLNTGGWTTPTTKRRFTSLLSCSTRLNSYKGIWLWGVVPFFDGMKVNSTGDIIGALPQAYLDAKREGDECVRNAVAAVQKLCADPVFNAKRRLGVLEANGRLETATLITSKLTPAVVTELVLRDVVNWPTVAGYFEDAAARAIIQRKIRRNELWRS